jgi:hypothetical protein
VIQQGDNGSRKWQRYEAKYLVSEWQAAEIRRYCIDHLAPDPYAAQGRAYEYPVNSLYLDSASRVLLRHTLQRRMKRYKLRVRTYRACHEPWADLPAFVEIKRRLNGIVHKTRARVGPELTEPLLWSEGAMFKCQGAYDRATEANVNAFLQLRNLIGAFPIVGTYYMREAYEGISAERVRITLDRDICCGIWSASDNGLSQKWLSVNAGGVVLEVKFTNTYPFWVANMLRRLEIMRRGVCKYVMCAQAAGLVLGSRSMPESFVASGKWEQVYRGAAFSAPAAALRMVRQARPSAHH